MAKRRNAESCVYCGKPTARPDPFCEDDECQRRKRKNEEEPEESRQLAVGFNPLLTLQKGTGGGRRVYRPHIQENYEG